MQILDRFYITSDFDREYLRNETRYQKSERQVISSDSAKQVRWTLVHYPHVSLDLPKSTFSTNYISALSGAGSCNFYTR